MSDEERSLARWLDDRDAPSRAVLAAAMAYYRAENACVAAQATYDLLAGGVGRPTRARVDEAYRTLRHREDERERALTALEESCGALDRAEKGEPR